MADIPEGLELLRRAGGSAYPSIVDFGDAQMSFTGLTVRDWFAGQALAGLTSNSSVFDSGAAAETKHCVWCAYALADAMLAARTALGGRNV